MNEIPLNLALMIELPLAFLANATSLLRILFLVFMLLALTLLEAGFSRHQRFKGLLLRNLSIAFLGIFLYRYIGVYFMYPGTHWLIKKHLGFAELALGSFFTTTPILMQHVIFQAILSVFTTLIACVSIAERGKPLSLLCFAVFMTTLLYPILGSWYWGGGWLVALHFHDMGGATLIHSVGGWAALAGVLIIGARIGKYTRQTVQTFRHANSLLILIGFCILYGSWSLLLIHPTLIDTPQKYLLLLSSIYLSASLGLIGSIITTLVLYKKIKLAILLRGTLASLVAISAGIDVLGLSSLGIIAFSIGIFIPLIHLGMERFLKIDDPVGVISIHLIGGIAGTLAVGIFSRTHAFMAQFVGVAAYAVGSFLPALVMFTLIEAIGGLRVRRDAELQGNPHPPDENFLENSSSLQ